MGYPDEILTFDYEKNLSVVTNNAVWDIKNGAVLKLTEGRQISHALFGFDKLTQEQIKSKYGNPPIFTALKWPESNKQVENVEGAHMTMMGYFESCKIPVICHIVQLLRKGVIKDKSYQQFAYDLL